MSANTHLPQVRRQNLAHTQPAHAAVPEGVSRREFLNYIWAASMALLLTESATLTYLFAFPRFRPEDFGSKFALNVDTLPKPNAAPVANYKGKFWLVNTSRGVMAQYKVCPHLGCIFEWDSAAKGYACRCHGSQYSYDGNYKSGPAPRGLDRFAFEVRDVDGIVIASSPDGSPLDLAKFPAAAQLVVDTGNKVAGPARQI